MNTEELIVGKIYEAKKPTLVGNLFNPCVNDRQILWMSWDKSIIQYDSPSVKNGGTYPKITLEKFTKWVGREVTSEVPDGTWRNQLPNKVVS